MVRILNVIYGLGIGGAETFIKNIMEGLSANEYKIDFAIQNPEINNEKIKDLILQRNSKIHIIPQFYKRPFSNALAIKKISSNYDVIHIHLNSLINFLPILLLNKIKCKVIVHSHNSKNNLGGKIGYYLHIIGRNLISSKRITRVACSKVAEKWMFKCPAIIIPNGVNTKALTKPNNDFEVFRSQFPDNITQFIGHIGRFVDAKNHEYLIDIFKKYVTKHPSTALLMIGDGNLRIKIEERVKSENIHNVFFLGIQQDVSKYYKLFSCLLFPSKFEGLPFVLIEAQAAGCPIVTSNNVSHEIELTSGIRFCDLSDGPEIWIETIENVISESNSEIIRAEFLKSDFNIDNCIKLIKKLYTE